jgi:putative Holliday junction resolvase
MARILAIDYGTKRTGIAVTDPEQRIASGLTTVPTHELVTYLKNYLKKESVEYLVVGEPKNMKNLPSSSAASVELFLKKIAVEIPELQIVRMDERLTSKIAFQTMIDSGLKKKDRQDKKMVDMISAILILQSYLENRDHKKGKE